MGLRRFLRRAKWDRARLEEIESYKQIETDENISRGMTPDEARAAARRKLGNSTLIREEIYHMNSISVIDALGARPTPLEIPPPGLYPRGWAYLTIHRIARFS